MAEQKWNENKHLYRLRTPNVTLNFIIIMNEMASKLF